MVNNSDSSKENNLQFDNRSLDEIIAEAGKRKETTDTSDGDPEPPEHNRDEPPHYPNNDENLEI